MHTHKTHEWMTHTNNTVRVSYTVSIKTVSALHAAAFKQLHLQLSYNSQLLQLMNEKEETLNTGGKKEETSSEELNKFTNLVWDPMTRSSSNTTTHLSSTHLDENAQSHESVHLEGVNTEFQWGARALPVPLLPTSGFTWRLHEGAVTDSSGFWLMFLPIWI